jgi:hypothetical protein
MRRLKRLLLTTLAVALAGTALAAPAQAKPTTVSISGYVLLDSFVTRLEASATGTAASLVGGGTDSPLRNQGNGIADPFSFCEFPLTGSVEGNTVTLAGTVEISNGPFEGTPIAIRATDTGRGQNDPITFVFDGLTLVGTGSVVIANG